MEHTYWGPRYNDDQIKQILDRADVAYYQLDNIEEMTATLLANEFIIGWFSKQCRPNDGGEDRGQLCGREKQRDSTVWARHHVGQLVRLTMA